MAGLYPGDKKSGQVWVRTPGKLSPSVYNDLRGLCQEVWSQLRLGFG